MTWTGKLLLAAWTAACTTGTVVTHRHAAPARHAHGLGWASLAAATGSPAGERGLHHHYVLAGVEFGGVPGGRGDGRDAGAAPVVSAGELPETETAADPAVPPFAPADRAATPRARHLPAPAPPAPSALCPVARHARTGVLLS